MSNFTTEHLRRLLAETSTVPAVNQIELYPRLPQTELRALHAEHAVATEAWIPLAQSQVLADLETGQRIGPDPAEFNADLPFNTTAALSHWVVSHHRQRYSR